VGSQDWVLEEKDLMNFRCGMHLDLGETDRWSRLGLHRWSLDGLDGKKERRY
jgi:hypothetical protein